MKFLKYLSILILLLVIVFFAKGLITPSISYESQIIVNKSAAEAMAVMSDESKIKDWLEGYIRTELVSGTAGTLGAVSNIYVDNNGQEMAMKETIKKVELNKAIAMDFSMDFMEMEYEIILDESPNNTTIKSTTKVLGNGLFAKSLVSFMKGTMKKQEDINMNNLKKVIEENTTNYFPEPVVEEAVEM